MFLLKSESSLTLKDPNTIKAQKHSKVIVEIIHVTSAVILRRYENNFCVQRKQNNDFIQWDHGTKYGISTSMGSIRLFKEVSSAHECCIYLIKILKNVITI